MTEPTETAPMDIFGVEVPLKAWSIAKQLTRGWDANKPYVVKQELSITHLVAMSYALGERNAQARTHQLDIADRSCLQSMQDTINYILSRSRP